MQQKRSLLKSDFGPALALIINLVMAYVWYFLARIIFLLENYNLLGEGLSWGHLAEMFRGGLLFDTSAIIYTNMLWIVMMIFPLWLKETGAYHRVCRWLYTIVNFVCFAINLADSVYFPFTLRRTTTSVFREFDNENNIAGIVFQATLQHWYLLLAGIVVAVLMYRLYVVPRTDQRDYFTPRSRWRFALVNFIVLAAAVPLCVGGCRGGLQSGVRPITINNANQYVDRPVECGLVLNTPFALLRTIGKNVFEVPPYYNSLDASAKVFSPIHRPSAADTARIDTTWLRHGTMGKKNIVVLIVESFGREYIGAFNKHLEGGRYKGYTPNVDKLIEKSLVFRYSYANGHKSIDGMPSILCGIPMMQEPFVLTPASMNTYTGFPGYLKKWGYQSAFFHGANRGSMGFLAFANKIGFDQYYGRQDYDADPRFGHGRDDDFDGNWGIWDGPFLQYWCTKIGELRQPFMTACFTVSSHHPFVIPDKYKNRFKGGPLPIEKCIQYTDMAIGRFFETASKQPWFKNTIFVMTSDHTNQSRHPEYETDLGTFSAPIIIYDPSGNLRPGMMDAVAQQIDILPTVMGMIGYDKPYLSFGCDLLHTPANETYALSFINGTYQMVEGGHFLQWDGTATKGFYSLNDPLLKHNDKGNSPEQKAMETKLKAIIYQYMYRMVNDKLMP